MQEHIATYIPPVGVRLFGVLPAFLAALLVCHAAYSAEQFGSVDDVSGSAEVADQYGKSVAVSVGLKILEGQTINTGTDGEVHIVTEDGGIVAVRPNTVFRVDEYKAEGGSTDRIFMSLLKGAIRSITGWVGKYNNAAYRISTPSATIGIRGTDHETTVIDQGDGDEPGTYDTVNEGATVIKTAQGTAEVTPGRFAFAPRGRAAAPNFLVQHPRFFAQRKLKIEQRIRQRKELLHSRLERMREERVRRLRPPPGDRRERLMEQGDHPRAQILGEEARRRDELRKRRPELRGQQRKENHAGSGNQMNRGDSARTQRHERQMKKDGEKGRSAPVHGR